MKNIFKNNMSWKDVTLDKFLEMKDILKDDISEEEKTIELVKLFIDPNADDLTPIDFFKLANQLTFLKEPAKRQKIRKRYTLNGHAYKCIIDLKDLTTAQYIDYSNLIKNKIDDDKITEIIAILLIPEDKKYNTDYDIDEVKEDILHYMTVEEAFGIADFFTKYFLKSFTHSLDCLEKAIAKSPELTFKERLKMTIEMKQTKKQLTSLLATVF